MRWETIPRRGWKDREFLYLLMRTPGLPVLWIGFRYPEPETGAPGAMDEGGTKRAAERKRRVMETRVAMLAVVVEQRDQAEELNHILHTYGSYIIGRMGIPYEKRGISLISIALDAPQDVISALAGKIGRLPGVTAKAVYSKVEGKKET